MLAIVGMLAALAAIVPSTPAASAPSVASRFEPLAPVRLVDTRDGTGGYLGKSAVGGTVGVPIGNRVPANATAVVLNLTVTDPDAFGYVTAYAGSTRPGTSNANTDEIGETAANLVVVPLNGGDVRVFTSMSTHLIVDLLGWFEPAGTATSGRYRPVPPAGARILDTRNESAAPIALADRRVVNIVGRAGVPAAGVRAVALNITLTGVTTPGWLQAIPTGGTTVAGGSSNVNATRAGQTVANLVMVPVGADGSITLAGIAVGHVIIDVAGWFTDNTATAGTDGLFITVDPVRLADSRNSVTKAPVTSGATMTVNANVAGVDVSRLGAVLANLTVTDSASPGFVTGYSGTGTLPTASNINADKAGATVANAGIVATAGSSFGLYASTTTHLVVDLLGWFTTSSQAPPDGVGTVISSEPVQGGLRVHYRTIGAANNASEQITLVYTPSGTPPAGGWPIMALVHGPSGLGDQCAPSNANPPLNDPNHWLAEGYAVVFPDLEGLGMPGDHPYLHGLSEAHSMLDAVRAARNLLGASLSNKVVSYGFSSGGHGSLWMGEIAPSYAPELDMRGVISLDPISIVSWVMDSNWSFAGFAVWMVQGQHLGDPTLAYSDVMRQAAIDLLPTLNSGCLDDTYPIFDGISGGPLHTNPMTLPRWAAAFRANDSGQRRSAPVWMGGGNDFTAAIPAIDHSLHNEYMARACALGTSVHFQIFNGGHMAMLGDDVVAGATAFANAQVRGTPQTGCTTAGP